MQYGEINLFTIYGIGIALVVSFLLPVICFAIWKIKRNIKIKPLFIGALIFILFSLGFELVCNQIFLYKTSSLQQFITGNVIAYIAYAGLLAAVFEEGGRLLAFKFLMHDDKDIVSSVTYGIGHGGAETILVIGMTMISNLLVLITVKMVGIEAFLSAFMGELAISMQMAIENLYSSVPGIFLLSGLECIAMFALQVALSVLVFVSVKRKGKWYLFPAAILIHTAFDILAILYTLRIINSIPIVIAGVFLIAALTVWLSCFIIKSDKKEQV